MSRWIATASIRARFVGFGIAMLVMLATAALVVPRIVIDTDILALLPRSRDAAVERALERLNASLSQRQIFLVGAENIEKAKAAARRFADALALSPEFGSVQVEASGDAVALLQGYRSHWPYLLADEDRRRLQADDTEGLYADALRAAYTPAGMMRIVPLAEDPLGLANNFLKQQLPSLGKAHLDGSMLVAHRDARSYVLVMAETRDSVFSADVQDRALPAIEAAELAARDQDPAVDIVVSGALRHAAAATRRAKAEIATFGAIETVAVLSLLFFVFGSFRPLVLGALVLGLSILAAIVASHFIFGKLHIMAMVFGASLIGVVIDYSMHFFADRFRLRNGWTPAAALAHVGPAILLGMAITIVGYFGLVLMPFPGLRQIAAFCIVGIVVGCGSVLCLYPFLMTTRWLGLTGSLPQRGPYLAGMLDRGLGALRWSRGKIAVCVVVGIALLAGVPQVRIEDDIRALQSSPSSLLADEQQVQDILGGGVETRFFLIQAPDAQLLLQREEALRDRLDSPAAAGLIGSYIAVSRALPSKQRQTENNALLMRQVYAADGLLPRVLQRLGFKPAAIDGRLRALRAARPIEPEAWLATPAAAAYRNLWLGGIGAEQASIVTLSGIADAERLHALTEGLTGVRLVDRPREVSAVMRAYRQATTWLLLFANGVALALLSWRFGWRGGARMALPSAAACLATVGIFGWLGVPVNLFNVFALLLVLALGVDYGIFLRHGQSARLTAILSVTLSACTTLIGFGMLAFSETPFIRSIGLTLLCGIVCSWIIVMLSCMTHGRPSAEVES